MSRPSLPRRLERLLTLVPAVARCKDGYPLARLMRELGYTEQRELLADIQLLQNIALPPAAPDDFIDVYVEQGRVYLFLPQGLDRPPRLTVTEAAALLVALGALGSSSPRVKAALGSLRRAMPRGMEKALDLARSGALPEAPASPWQPLLEQALREHRAVEVCYFSLSRGAAATRRLHPVALFVNRGHRYLAAVDPAKGDERLFRLDRISEAVLLDEKCPARSVDTSRYLTDYLYFASGQERPVQVRLTGAAAVEILEWWPGEVVTGPDGSRTITLLLGSDPYALSWVLRHGGQAEILSPPDLRRQLRDRLASIRVRHDGEGTPPPA